MINNFLIPSLFGIIEGFIEFIPISSTAHMVILSSFLKLSTNNNFKLFEVIIQSGCIISIIIKFRLNLYKFNKLKILDIRNKKIIFLNIKYIIISLLPIIIIGLFLNKKIINNLNKQNITYGLITGSVIMMVSRIYIKKFSKNDNLNKLNYLKSFFIGCFQCLALFPGISRLGMSITGCLLTGLNLYYSYIYSLILYIPIIIGSSILSIYNYSNIININDIRNIFIGFIFTILSSLISINFILKIVNKNFLLKFSLYRIIISIILTYKKLK